MHRFRGTMPIMTDCKNLQRKKFSASLLGEPQHCPQHMALLERKEVMSTDISTNMS